MLSILVGAWILQGAGAASGDPRDDARESQETGAGPNAFPEVSGITRPHQDATLASIQPARVTRLIVSEGQLVEEGELLVVLDDGVQRVRTEKAEADAASTIVIELAAVKMEQSSRDLERIRKLGGDDSASSKELYDARAIADTARLRFEEAKFRREQAVRDHEFQRLLLERLLVRAPFAGYVAKTFKAPGESVWQAEDLIRIVALNPLDVSIDCPLSAAHTIEVGSRFAVLPDDPRWEPRTGEVVFASSIIDPASQTVRIKLRIDNENGGWIAGMKVRVSFAAPLPEEQARLIEPTTGGSALDESRVVSKHD